MVYAFIQDVPIGEQQYRSIMDEHRPRADCRKSAAPVRARARRPAALHRRLGVRGGLRQGVRRADPPGRRCRFRWATPGDRTGSAPTGRPARQRLGTDRPGVGVTLTDPATARGARPSRRSRRRCTTAPPSPPGWGCAPDRALVDRRGRAQDSAGRVVLAAGVVLAGAGVATVMRAQHDDRSAPSRRAMLTTGVYRLSRNPMYAGLALAYLGVAAVVGVLVAVPDLPTRPAGRSGPRHRPRRALPRRTFRITNSPTTGATSDVGCESDPAAALPMGGPTGRVRRRES